MNPNKVSSTAIFVANGVWWVANHENLSIEVPGQMARYNLEMVKHINMGLFSVQHGFGRRILKVKTSIMLKASMPGFYLHFVIRKRCIAESVRAAINNGAKQLVVIGAGFDTLSLEMANAFPDIIVIEIDHPATQAWKRKALDSIDQRFDNLHLIPLDLSRSAIQEALSDNACYDKEKVSVFVAEGLLMYLEENEVRDIFRSIRENSGMESTLIFTYMEENISGGYDFSDVSMSTTLWLYLKQETFTWGLNRDQLVPFLDQFGFNLLDCITHNDLRRHFISTANKGASLVMGENVAIAQLRQRSPQNGA